MIEIDGDLKVILICALRYALGRRTYITDLVSEYIMNHPELIDKKPVMLSDLEEYFECRGIYYHDDECDYNSWVKLKEWLENLEVEE